MEKLSELNVDYSKYMTSEETVHQVVTALSQYGLAFINGCPAGPDASNEIENITTRIGPLKNTFYGLTWDVRSVQDAKNVAYTSDDLDLHMDLLYYESPPGLQFLHCLQNQVTGGTSVFVDSFSAAQQLKESDPAAYAVLTQYPVDYHYHNDGVHYHQSRPTFVTKEGKLEYVNYSPPFQGTQTNAGFEAYHAAIQKYAALLKDPRNRYETVLREGQCVVFNNRRTLHARTSFGAGLRWLKGSYTDVDALHSKFRTGLERLQ